ncbi:SDR family NAD(P)-dependent oxidoreductase [Chitinophaga japonensis]|uniref:NAD(P)-dependent dehydrogenase (Short-subunit alcohol dehydrogenase family) n=1 Tax=Chitinophaga japonensis TaxID=104662 RepID=A0A562STW6_CHIJA|nr:SDR family oxidoreductase [Chitinophaga japonensis]TWI84498.1 NAD(P)-dependent dehydrogenase (short-subunit alcohol dehydrogenase family) [Chitinophaga japonensis]
MKANRLAGKVAIVTGGGTGIGEAVCKKFAAEGAKVLVVGFADDPVEAVAQEIAETGGEARAYMGDVAKEVEAEAAVQAAIDNWGALHILVNCAGVYPVTAETQDLDVEIFDLLIKDNLRNTFLMTRAALPFLQKTGGCIVNTGSEAGFLGQAMLSPYGGTKAFIHAFTRGVALEQAKHGVRANAVCPGPVDTSWTHKETGPMDEKMEQSFLQTVSMGRRGTTEEVANVFLFLASDEASFVNGSLYSVDGGIIGGKGIGKEAPASVASEPEPELALHHEHDGKTGRRN